MGTARSLRRRQERMSRLLDPPMPGPQVRFSREEIRERAQLKYERRSLVRQFFLRRRARYLAGLKSDPVLAPFRTPVGFLAEILADKDRMVQRPHVRRAAAKRRRAA